MPHVTGAVVASAFAVALGAAASAQPGAIQIPKPPVAPKPGWVTPKTAWGDPDISGNFTNKYEQGTPMERPAGFEGRGVDEVRGAELNKLLEDRQRQSDARQPFLAGDPTGRIAVLPEFGDRGEIVKGHRAWMLIDPADGKMPAMREEAQRRTPWRDPGRTGQAASSFSNAGFDSQVDFSLTDRCITRGYPGSMLPGIYGDSYQIVQGPGYVGIRYEMIHEIRIIPLDSRPHVSKDVRLDMGDARGHWVGNSLVVETTNFRDRSVYRNANPTALKITERFTRTAPDTVEWTVTIDDPTTWVRPWTFSLPLTMNDHEAVLEYACHEGNYALRNMLSGERATEREAGVVHP
jgi:hypothetical protein